MKSISTVAVAARRSFIGGLSIARWALSILLFYSCFGDARDLEAHQMLSLQVRRPRRTKRIEWESPYARSLDVGCSTNIRMSPQKPSEPSQHDPNPWPLDATVKDKIAFVTRKQWNSHP